LESYARLGTPIKELEGAGVDEASSMARQPCPTVPGEPPEYQRLRQQTPDQAGRDGVPVGQATFRWLDGCEIDVSGRETMAALAVDRVPVAAEEKVVLARGTWDRPRVYLERIKPGTPGDCGWYVGPADDVETTAYESIRASDLLSIRPDWTEILALPAGYLVIVDRGRIETVLDPRDEIVFPAGQATTPG